MGHSRYASIFLSKAKPEITIIPLCGGGMSDPLYSRCQVVLTANTPISYRAISAALAHPKVQARLRQGGRFPGEFKNDERAPMTSMAFLEMLTGYRAEVIYKEVDSEAKGRFLDWMLGEKVDDAGSKLWNLPTANWNPTVMGSVDTGIRAVKPFPKMDGITPTGNVTLQDTRASGPDFTLRANAEDEAYDRVRTYNEIWDVSLSWAAHLRIKSTFKGPLLGAASRVGTLVQRIRETEYFVAKDHAG